MSRPPTDVGTFAGRHVLAEFEGVDPARLDDPVFLRTALEDALTSAGATVCDTLTKRFEPHGVTVVAMLTESHASVHTYPEIGAVFVDVFTCGDRADPDRAVALFAKALDPESITTSCVHRGHTDGTREVR